MYSAIKGLISYLCFNSCVRLNEQTGLVNSNGNWNMSCACTECYCLQVINRWQQQ